MNLLAGFSNTRRLVATAIASGILLVLPACGIPPLRPSAPGPNLPAEYSAPDGFEGASKEENSSTVGIDEFFNDSLLTGLIGKALAGNQELRILYEDVAIANNEVWGRSGAYLPMLSLGAGASIEKPSRYTRNGAVESELPILPGRPFPNPLPDYLVAGNISWQLDIWRQLRNARDVATLRSLATGEGRNYAVTRLVAEVADNYYELMALDRRLEILDVTIDLQEQSLKMARAKFDAGRGTELAVQRFVAEVAKNRSEKLIVKQEIIEAENRVNFRVGRFPQGVERSSMDYMKFVNLNLHPLAIGVPTHLLRNRPDIRQAERELEAAGLDILVARARFFPQPVITAGIGYEAFNPKYLFNTPEALIYNVAGNLVAPLINRRAIQADYNNANARQLQAIYNYQRVVLNAFTEVVNRVNMVENYRKSIELKKQQLAGLESAVAFATKLFNQARVEYIDVLFSLRDLQDAKMVITDTKRQQLSAIINTYQALGGGNLMPNSNPPPPEVHPIFK